MVAAPDILVLAGTRPECIKLAPVIAGLERHRSLRVLTVNSGQHAEAVTRSFAEFSLASDIALPALPPLPHLGASCAHLQRELRAVIASVRPRLVLVQGDTLTTYAGARAAHEEGVCVAHLEAGLRTDSDSDPFPEEWFRRRIAQRADLHFAPTPLAVDHLLAEGVAGACIHHVGNTGIDTLRALMGELVASPREENLVLVTLHRRENCDGNAAVVCRALRSLVRVQPGLRLVFPVHPNPRIGQRIRRELGSDPAFALVLPLGYRDFIGLAARAALIVSDSGGIQEEAPHLGTPLLVPRRNTERPESLATGFTRLVDTEHDALLAAALATLRAPRAAAVPFDDDAPFGDGHAATRVIHVLERQLVQRAYA